MLNDRIANRRSLPEQIRRDYGAFSEAYCKIVSEAYRARWEEARKWYREECARRKQSGEKAEKQVLDLSQQWDKVAAESNYWSGKTKEVKAEYDKLYEKFERACKERDEQLAAYNEACALFEKRHSWYARRTGVVTQGKGAKRKTWFEVKPEVSGFGKKLVRLYEIFHSSADKDRMMAVANRLSEMLSRRDILEEQINAVHARLEDCMKKHEQALDEWDKLEKGAEKILDAAESTVQKAEGIGAYAYLENPLTPKLVREDKSGRLAVSAADLKALLKKVPGCDSLKEAALAMGNLPDIYLQREVWDNWVAQKIADREKNLAAGVQEDLEALPVLREKSEQTLGEIDRQRKALETQWEVSCEAYRKLIGEWRAAFDTIGDPAMVPVWNDIDFSPETAKAVCGEIAAAATDRVVMPLLPVGYDKVDTTEGIVTLPKLAPWQQAKGKSNFLIEYARDRQPQAVAAMNDLLMQMLLAFPAKKLRFTFVDLNVTNQASLFTINLDANLYHNDPVVKEQDLRKRLEELQDRMVTVSKQCSNLLKYNRENGTILFPYEVVVLLDYPRNLSPQTINQLKPLCTNGHNGGIFFVVLREKNEGEQPAGFASMPDIVTPDSFCRIDLQPEDETDSLNRYRPVAAAPVLREACFAHINAQAQKEEQARIIEQPMEELYNEPFADAADEFKVAVGENNGRAAWFRLDEASHPHAFVLGQSGSGKSVFLHNVVGNAVLRYSPESLQLYLLDFKLGGVEFNRYKDVKHVRALLVDNSDQQITLEILRGLYETMRRRGEMLRGAGVSSLRDYNAAHPDDRLPRILLAVDECHELFRDRMDRIQTEINAIVTKIAKEGRSQGVHLLFATQTLANANIPSEILNNISDYYLLKCAQNDAEKLVRDSSKQTSALTTGWLLYANEEKRELFQAYYADRQRMEENLRRTLEKSASASGEGRFFFSGKQRFPLDESVLDVLKRKSRRHPAALMGRSIDVRQSPVALPLKAGMGENILLFGINTKEQTTRVSIDLLITLVASYRQLERPCRFYIVNCLSSSEESAAEEVLYALERYGCTVVEDAARGELLGTLAEEVRNRTAQESVVLLLGQERFREVRLEAPLASASAAPAEPQVPAAGHLGGFGSLGRREEKRTYKSELRYLLENGPEQHVHFLLQVDKPGNLLFESVISQQMVFSMFKHIVMLKSAPDAALKLRLSDEVKLENLSDEEERLRAYYYNDEEGTYTLFTPYVNPAPDQLGTLLK